ncbi:MAG: hypothetical protein IPG12_07040 [Saprospiraceae bacterium]|nr:hypothetical protein [Saprospiraceae bacterium]
MKTIFSIFICTLIITSCVQPLADIKDYFPTISNFELEVNQDGTVNLDAKVDKGNTDLVIIGFCYDTLPNPKPTTNQLLANYDGVNMYIVAQNFIPFTKYYFKAWAANDDGYTLSNEIEVDQINAKTIVPPCNLAPNYIKIGLGSPAEYIDKVELPVQTSALSEYQIRAFSNSVILDLRFGQYPYTGKYKIVSGSPKNKEIFVSFISGFISDALKSGDVIVNQIKPSEWEIVICDGLWKTSLMFNTRFKCPQ